MENKEIEKARENIQNFSDMVNATEKMTAPWRKANFVQTIALIITNFLWAVIVALLVWFAYMTPVDVEQNQNMQSQTQSQNVTQGK